jgi:hypothetical protein
MRTSRRIALSLVSLSIIAGSSVAARADLSSSQARKALTRVAGAELKNGDVRVRSVSTTSKTSGTMSADVRTVFKFQANKDGKWHVDEFRIGQERWENVSLVSRALGLSVEQGNCNAPDPPFHAKAAVDPSAKRARCLIGSLLGIDVPSDAIRIQQISTSSIPFASEPSALVVAWIRVDAQLIKDRKDWRVVELRTGDRSWMNVDNLMTAVNEQKVRQARADMATIAGALEKYRRDRGSYVVSDKHGVAVDFLSPRYLGRVIRLDPWNQPYQYTSTGDHFTLRSLGPDHKADTADDILN